MGKRIRWNNKEEARRYAFKCINEGRTGLSFCAALDYVGEDLLKQIKSILLFRESIYADSLYSRGLKEVYEDITIFECELFYDTFKSAFDYDECLSWLQVAKDTAKEIKRRKRR